jgi:perosamine synthetase
VNSENKQFIAKNEPCTESTQICEERFESIAWWNVDLGPAAAKAASEAVICKFLSQGPITEEIETQISRITGTKYAVATSSGSTALTLALMAAGARLGDIVVCPAYTWIATAHAARILGCEVEIVDIQKSRPVMDVSKVKHADAKRRFAIPVHMNGHAADVKSLKEKGYIVIEDAAQALGSRLIDRYLGALGDAGCYSFSISKIIGSGQGGLIVSDSELLAETARRMRTHGITNVFAPDKWEVLGHNLRYNDVLASILRTQIPLLRERLHHARMINETYLTGLRGIRDLVVVTHESSEEVGPYVEVRTLPENRDRLIKILNQKSIDARRAFPSLSTATYLGVNYNNNTPNADSWSKEVLYLPSGPGLSIDKVKYIANFIRSMYDC